MSHTKRPFRIIIVGAGPAGKHSEVAPPKGAGISMWPHGLRIIHQLGCLDAIKAASVLINRFQGRASDGRLVHDNLFYAHVEENHGIGFFPLERRQFLKILYDGLPDKSFIKTGAAVESVRQLPDKVEVQLTDGNVETGDMVLGCDGVHSLVRSDMWDHASRSSPGLIQIKEKKSHKASWKTLAMTTPEISELGERNLTVTYIDGVAFLVTSQPDAAYFFVIFRLDMPFTWPKRERYTDGDAEALAELVADKPVTNQIVFAEVWKRRNRAVVIALEEYVTEHWHHGRIAVCGDAVHKLHPNMALGGNSAIEGVVSVINHINRVMLMTKGPKPSATALNMAFMAYQNEQCQRMVELMDLSNFVAKIHTYANPFY
ncbi:hypothetical protein F5Y19DRAFT_484078 [Xylariaceae sp. FL1651]|nr:hypothetical protein F5Y19DRAFT_484078 [Xylariaceae sp. FL1651]